MTGPTSDAASYVETHRVELIERHDITLPMAGRNVNTVVEQCRLAAEDWLADNGLDGETVTPLSSSDGSAGVTFTVTLGRGHIDPRQIKHDEWTWSARAYYWAELLHRTFGRATRRIHARRPTGGEITVAVGPSGLATVTALRPGHASERQAFGVGPAPEFSEIRDALRDMKSSGTPPTE